MNSDQIKGKIEQVIGNVKQGFGEATGDTQTANDGLGDKLKGATRETWGNVKDAANPSHTNVKPLSDQTGIDNSVEPRQNLSDRIHEAKVAVNERVDEFKATHGR